VVKPKKHLGQHFLKDDNICAKIATSISFHENYRQLIEIGPGTGALTKHLLKLDCELLAMEVDTESITYLQQHYPELKLEHKDFLKMNVADEMGEQVGIAGNFPYNISSQIMFQVLKYRDQIPEVIGMFQKEVAERICEKHGNKRYGILSVLLQAFYDVEYLFTVSEEVFDPPPKVKSAVIRLKRKENYTLACDEAKFFTVVKTAFNLRRKMLRNSLKQLSNDKIKDSVFAEKRPEQLSVEEFVTLTKEMEGEI